MIIASCDTNYFEAIGGQMSFFEETLDIFVKMTQNEPIISYEI